jgi:hypothetical protein
MAFEIRIEYEQVQELIRDKHRNTVIKLKNGCQLFLTGSEAKRAYRKLCRNFEGEHLD